MIDNLCNDETNQIIWNYIQSQRCSDHVCISLAEAKALFDLFGIKHNAGVPADIVLCGTIPLHNIKITITDFWPDPDSSDFLYDGLDVEVFVFDKQCNKQFPDNETWKTVGICRMSTDMFSLFGVEKGKDFISRGLCGIKNINENKLSMYTHMFVKQNEDASMFVGAILSVWYIIQLSLLNPVTKDMFKNPVIVPTVQGNSKNAKKGKRKTKVRYIKKHYISDGTANKVIMNHRSESHQKKIFTKKAWYVCGHWRQYASGKRIFIKPYWKGVMRNQYYAVKNIDRERIIAQLDSNGEE